MIFVIQTKTEKAFIAVDTLRAAEKLGRELYPHESFNVRPPARFEKIPEYIQLEQALRVLNGLS